MPGMDGFELKQQLDVLQQQKGNPKIPFIFLSGCSAPQDIEQAKKLGARAYLVKPVEINTLMETIKKAFAPNFQSGLPRSKYGHNKAINPIADSI